MCVELTIYYSTSTATTDCPFHVHCLLQHCDKLNVKAQWNNMYNVCVVYTYMYFVK